MVHDRDLYTLIYVMHKFINSYYGTLCSKVDSIYRILLNESARNEILYQQEVIDTKALDVGLENDLHLFIFRTLLGLVFNKF